MRVELGICAVDSHCKKGMGVGFKVYHQRMGRNIEYVKASLEHRDRDLSKIAAVELHGFEESGGKGISLQMRREICVSYPLDTGVKKQEILLKILPLGVRDICVDDIRN